MSFKIFSLSFLLSSFSFSVCNQLILDNQLPAAGFRHVANSVFSLLDPHHLASDVITVVQHGAEINVKFSYGPLRKDLEDEDIEVWMDTCKDKLVLLGTYQTDSDGRVKTTLTTQQLPGKGAYKIWLRTKGDNTLTSFMLRVLEPGTSMAIFDIDGTLTYSEINTNTRTGAVETTHAVKALGREIVYLSGRHYFLTRWTRTFLTNHQFAEGTLVVGQSICDVIPSDSHVGEFKSRYLKYLKDLGLILERAYGDRTSDVYAYQSVQIPNSRIFILGNNGGYLGAVALGEDYLYHYTQISSNS
jgi:phosphatidate phosphatase PAH1